MATSPCFWYTRQRGAFSVSILLLLLFLLPTLALALDFSINSPADNTQVTPGQTITVSVSAWGSVAGIQRITCEKEGEYTDSYDFGMFPPTTSVSKNFSYRIPTDAVNNQILTITVRVEDWVDDAPPPKSRQVIVKTGPPPTPTPTPGPAYDSVTLAGTLGSAVYDVKRNALYVGNETHNRIDIVDAQTQALAGNIPLASTPQGIDITADRNALYVGATDEKVYKVNLDTRAVSLAASLDSFSYWHDEIPYYVACGIGKVYLGAGDRQWGDVIALNMEDGATTRVSDNMGFSDPMVVASGNDEYVFAAQGGISSGDVLILNSSTAATIASSDLEGYCYNVGANRSGNYYIWINHIYNKSLERIATLDVDNNLRTAAIFLPTRNVVAAFSGHTFDESTQILFYDVDQKTELKRIPGVSFEGLWPGRLYANHDGSTLFVVGEGKVYFIPTDYGQPEAAADPTAWSLYQ